MESRAAVQAKAQAKAERKEHEEAKKKKNPQSKGSKPQKGGIWKALKEDMEDYMDEPFVEDPSKEEGE